MAKTGRKRKEGPREASGKLSRAAAKVMEPASPGQVRRARDAALAKMLDREWGSELGRHYLTGFLNSTEYAAGKKYHLLFERHEGRRKIGDPTFEECAQIFAALSDARSAIMTSGYKNWSVFRRIVERNHFTPGTLEGMHLKDSLRALVGHWRMEG